MHLKGAGTLTDFFTGDILLASDPMQLNLHGRPQLPVTLEVVLLTGRFLLSSVHCLDAFTLGFCVSVGTCMGHIRTSVI